MKVVNGWVDTAIEIDYENKSMSRFGHKPTHLVMHGTAGSCSAQNIANYFATSAVDASAHLIIGCDGAIVQGISMDKSSWSNGVILNPSIPYPPTINPNYYSISIEHCKPSTDNSDNLTDAQKKSSFELTNAICNTYNIPKKMGDAHGGIVSHASFDSINRARCPGPYPWNELIDYLNGGSNMNVPQNWQYNSQTKVLMAPNNIGVSDGFAQWILENNWDFNNLPLMPAFGLNSVEIGNPGLGSGTVQPFRTKVLAWTPRTGVYEMWVGQEYVALYKLINQTNQALSNASAEIIALKKQINTKIGNDGAVMQLKKLVSSLDSLKEETQNNILKLSPLE